MSQVQPPKWATALILRLCDGCWVDEILGDLAEQFEDNRAAGRPAKLIYWWEALRFLRPHILKKLNRQGRIPMTFHHLKISTRNLMRNKVYAFINIMGLAVGLASVLLIGIYIQFETSYDKFFDDSDRIYRVALHRVYPGRTKDFGTSGVRIAPVLNADYPEVELATRIHRLFFQNEITVTFPDSEKSFIETRYLFADSLFFDVFSYPFIHGDPGTALDEEDNVILTASTALKYFGDTDVIGRQLLSNDSSLVVAGVIEDIPANSHIHFDVLGTTTSLGFLDAAESSDNWTSPWINTYIRLREDADPMALEAKFDDMVETYGGASLATAIGANWKEEGHAFEYFLQPLTSIHLHSKTDVEIEPNSDIAYIYVLSAIAMIILLISAINFINLSIARSTERAKEVGIRKVLGSYRRTLIHQFLTESLVVCLIAATLAILFLWAFIPQFNRLLGTSLAFDALAAPLAIVGIFLAITIVGLLSGLYPALAISALQPSRVLKGSYKSSSGGVWLRNTLIVVQFLMSIVMISGSIIAASQMDYLRRKDLGFSKDNLMVVKQSFRLGSNYDAFVNEVRSMAGVEALGGSNMVPGIFHGSNVFEVSDPTIADLRVNTSTIDDDYLEAMDMEVLSGRGFSREFNDSLNVLINESAALAMGRDIESVLGLKFINNLTGANAQQLNIIGVVRDYHFYSLHSEIGPMVIFNGNTQFIPGNTVIRINGQQTAAVLDQVTAKWQDLSATPFAFSFLEDDLSMLYEADRNTATLFNIFTYIAIVMSCVGLFGLATYVVNQRAKEMSIRKVLGGSIPHIIQVFSRDFMILIGVAFLIGVPVAVLVLRNWLESFAYHVDINPMYFVLAGAVTVGLVFLTVSYQALKLAFVNPVKMLRSE